MASPSLESPPSKKRRTNEPPIKEPVMELTSSFEYISNMDYFVDKTLMIKAVLETVKFMLITAPRRFGKSTNLNMLHCFFSGSCSRDIFAKLKVGLFPDIMSHYGQYPVIFINFCWHSCDIMNYDDVVKAFRVIMHKTFRNHKYLIDSDKLDDGEKVICGQWMDRKAYESLSEIQVGDSLLCLAECVFKHHGKKSILLIDEFDSICSTVLLNVDQKELNRIIRFYSSFVGQVVKHNNEFIERAILTGVAHVTCEGLSPLNNVEPYKFLDNENFFQFYGLLEDEFNELMQRKCCKPVIEKKDEAFEFYNGYSYKDNKILSIWSVMNFICKGDLLPFWKTSGVVSGLYETIKSDNVRHIIEDLLLNESIDVDSDCCLSPFELSSFYEASKNPNYKFTNISVLLHFLLQQGYLNVVHRKSGIIQVKIPNKEIKIEFKKIIQHYYTQICKFDLTLIYKCNNCCSDMNLNDVNSCTTNLSELCNLLDALLTDSKDLKEAWLEHFLFYIFFPNFDVKVQEKVGTARDKRKHKIFDLLLHRLKDNAYFLFELKVDETAEIALETIIGKKYHTYESVINGHYLLIGMNLNTVNKNKITIAYLHNSVELQEKILIA